MIKQMQGVTIQQPLKGRAAVLPRMILSANGDSSFAVTLVDPLKIVNFLIAPVVEFNKNAKLAQETRDGWDRVIKAVDFSKTTNGTKPLIVSARKSWNMHEGEINVIESAYILDGARYLEYLQNSCSSQYVPMIVIFNKSEKEEHEIRQRISEAVTFSINDIKNKVGTDAPRLTINEKWVEIKIVSDPFVVKTGMGYTAAINVIELKSNTIHHVIIGAKSLSNELEKIRYRFGSLSNVNLKIRKQSTESKSQYEIST